MDDFSRAFHKICADGFFQITFEDDNGDDEHQPATSPILFIEAKLFFSAFFSLSDTGKTKLKFFNHFLFKFDICNREFPAVVGRGRNRK